MELTPTTRRNFLRSCVTGASAFICSTACSRPERVPFRLGSDAQLFLDGALLEESTDLSRTLHQPRKHGLIEEADGSPWTRGHLTSVVRDESGPFHLFYQMSYWDPTVSTYHETLAADRSLWFRTSPCYARSEDGVRWHKPTLERTRGPSAFRAAPSEKWSRGVFVEPSGFSLKNNQGAPIHAVQDLHSWCDVADPFRRFLVNVLQKDGDHVFAKTIDAGVYFASAVPDFVNDVNWRGRLEPVSEGVEGPRRAHTMVSGYDQFQKLWFICDQCTPESRRSVGTRQISRWTSQDLVHWGPETVVLPVLEDESREADDFVEYMGLSTYRVGSVWLGLLGVFHGDRSEPRGAAPTNAELWRKGLTEYRLLVSRDAGRSWKRVAGKQGWMSPHNREDGYDRLIGTANSMVRVGDEAWLYYECWDGDHLTWNRDGTTYYKDRMRIGRTARASLRWNGYLSLDANKRGEAITKPCTFSGTQLFVNLRAPSGRLRVELQDVSGKPLPGFHLADCESVTGDGIRLPVGWGTRPLPVAPREEGIRIRFVIERGSLYGFEFK